MARFALLRLTRSCCISIALASLLLVGQPPAQSLGWEDVVRAWSDVFKSPPPHPLRGVGRGGAFCIIAPFPTESGDTLEPATITRHPVFVWRGGAEWLKVRSIEGEVIWEKDLSTFDPDEALHRVVYTGLPLQPEQTYEWVIKSNNLATSLPIEFRVLSVTEQAEVDAELRSRETAVQRADYFAKRQLWSAFWDEVLSVEAPSADLQAVIQKTVQYGCDP